MAGAGAIITGNIEQYAIYCTIEGVFAKNIIVK